jgi:hypothetical protein
MVPPSGEVTMCACQHEIVEWEQRDQGMHVVGWACRWCSSLRAADYHHETGCRPDFCGAEPVVSAEATVRLSAEQFRIEFEHILYVARSRGSGRYP